MLLSVSDFDGLPVAVSVDRRPDRASARSRCATSLKDPTGDDERPAGHRAALLRGALHPPRHRHAGGRRRLVESLFGIVPVATTSQFDNLPFLRPDQLANPPLSDLADFGTDQQTGSQVDPAAA